MSSAVGTGFAHPENEFRKQCPFPVTATNIQGVYVIPAPPEHFDPNRATAAELVQHGLLWRQPTAIDNPALANAWQRLFARKWHARDHIVPHLEPQTGKTHIMTEKARRATETSYVNQQWAGAVLAGGGPWGNAVGLWDIPTVGQPTEAQGTEGGWNSSSWVGIDGFNTSTIVSNDVLQAGIEQKVDRQGNASYVAWFEWFAPQQVGSPSYIFQTNLSNFPVSPGQQVLCLVAYIPLAFFPPLILWGGYIVFADMTSGKTVVVILWPPPGATFAGNTAEWIMEAPDGGLPVSSLPKFTPVVFTSAGAGGYNKAIGNPQYADIVNIQTTAVPPKNLTSVSTGNDTVTINFIG